jgi:hypothetical protein
MVSDWSILCSVVQTRPMVANDTVIVIVRYPTDDLTTLWKNNGRECLSSYVPRCLQYIIQYTDKKSINVLRHSSKRTIMFYTPRRFQNRSRHRRYSQGIRHAVECVSLYLHCRHASQVFRHIKKVLCLSVLDRKYGTP